MYLWIRIDQGTDIPNTYNYIQYAIRARKSCMQMNELLYASQGRRDEILHLKGGGLPGTDDIGVRIV